MKLLFDQNLSHQLLHALQNEYPDSQHVRNVGLAEGSDEAVWQYAVQESFTIVTKDAEFHQRSFLFGHPPKVVWIRRGNCSTATIEQLLRIRRNHLILLPTEKRHFSSSSSRTVSPMVMREV